MNAQEDPEFEWENVVFFLFVSASTLLIFVGVEATAFRNLLHTVIGIAAATRTTANSLSLAL